MPEEKNKHLVDVEHLEISALDDKELEAVSGGLNTTVASCACCCACATNIERPPVA